MAYPAYPSAQNPQLGYPSPHVQHQRQASIGAALTANGQVVPPGTVGYKPSQDANGGVVYTPVVAAEVTVQSPKGLVRETHWFPTGSAQTTAPLSRTSTTGYPSTGAHQRNGSNYQPDAPRGGYTGTTPGYGHSARGYSTSSGYQSDPQNSYPSVLHGAHHSQPRGGAYPAAAPYYGAGAQNSPARSVGSSVPGSAYDTEQFGDAFATAGAGRGWQNDTPFPDRDNRREEKDRFQRFDQQDDGRPNFREDFRGDRNEYDDPRERNSKPFPRERERRAGNTTGPGGWSNTGIEEQFSNLGLESEGRGAYGQPGVRSRRISISEPEREKRSRRPSFNTGGFDNGLSSSQYPSTGGGVGGYGRGMAGRSPYPGPQDLDDHSPYELNSGLPPIGGQAPFPGMSSRASPSRYDMPPQGGIESSPYRSPLTPGGGGRYPPSPYEDRRVGLQPSPRNGYISPLDQPQGIPGAPPGFSRPVNPAQPFTPFDKFPVAPSLDHITQAFPELPSIPPILLHHDVLPEDWYRLMQDVATAWTQGRSFGSSRRLTSVNELVETWNQLFFQPRAVELAVFKNRKGRPSTASRGPSPNPYMGGRHYGGGRESSGESTSEDEYDGRGDGGPYRSPYSNSRRRGSNAGRGSHEKTSSLWVTYFPMRQPGGVPGLGMRGF